MKPRFIKGRSKPPPPKALDEQVASPTERKDGDLWMHPQTRFLMRWHEEGAGGQWIQTMESADHARFVRESKYGKVIIRETTPPLTVRRVAELMGAEPNRPILGLGPRQIDPEAGRSTAQFRDETTCYGCRYCHGVSVENEYRDVHDIRGRTQTVLVGIRTTVTCEAFGEVQDVRCPSYEEALGPHII